MFERERFDPDFVEAEDLEFFLCPRGGAFFGFRTGEALTDFGYNVGLAFQIIDDILDITQTSEQLGKTAGKDSKAQKATYPAIVGLERSRKIAQHLTDRAFGALKIFRGKAVALEALAMYLLQRDR